jgi:hypothetical protein
MPTAGGGAESTNIPSSTSSSTSTTRSPTLTPGGFTTSPSPATGSSSRPINAGVIAGAVVGGVVGLALIAALVFCFVYHRRTQRPQSTVNLMSPSMPTSPVSPATFGPTSKLHVRTLPSSSAVLIFIYSGFPRPKHGAFSNDFGYGYYARASSSIPNQLSRPAVTRRVISCPWPSVPS